MTACSVKARALTHVCASDSSGGSEALNETQHSVRSEEAGGDQRRMGRHRNERAHRDDVGGQKRRVHEVLCGKRYRTR